MSDTIDVLAQAAPSDRRSSTTLRVTAKEQVADGVVRLTLAAPTGARLPDWTPGSHVDLILPNGDVRQYSLCGDRWDSSCYRVAVLREPAGRGGSAYVHDELTVGSLVGIGGPRNNFPLAPGANYLFVAGGIGITPILPMLTAADRLGAQWNLLYGGRTRSSMAFADELRAWAGRVHLLPEDEHGLLPLASWLAVPQLDTTVYCCGPPPLLDAVSEMCAQWAPRTLRTERFVARTLAAPSRDEPFTVVLERSGVELDVDRNSTVLDAVRSAGADVLSSCREGTCGTCETAVLSGVPEHRDSIFDDTDQDRRDSMFICVSRSRSDRLVLDL